MSIIVEEDEEAWVEIDGLSRTVSVSLKTAQTMLDN